MFIRNQFLLLILIMNAGVLSASAQEPSAMIPNLRAVRMPIHAFEFANDHVTLQAVALTRPVAIADSWDSAFDVRLILKSRTEINSLRGTQHVRVTSFETDTGNRLVYATLRVIVPSRCHSSGPIATLAYVELESGGIRQQLPVDHVCIVGRSAVVQMDMESLVDTNDPVVQLMAREVGAIGARNFVRLTQALAMAWVARGGRYTHDPLILGLSLHEPDAYALPPAVTLRYGGDCEDLAIVTASVLRVLGLDARIHTDFAQGHVYNQVLLVDGSTTDIDITPEVYSLSH